MGKHTKEPWVLFEVGYRHVHFCPASATDKTSILTVTEEDGVSFAAVYNDDDARRIVACVNALQGVPTEELERHHLGHAGEVQFRIEMTKQRDELLAAIEGLLSDGCVVMNCGNGVLHSARIAIAKAKGGAA